MLQQVTSSYRHARTCQLGRYFAFAFVVLLLMLVASGALAQTHVSNPFVGAQGYVNPDYAAEIATAEATASGTLKNQMAVVATYPTAVWMDHIGAITATSGAHRGLAAHITAALAQQSASGSGEPVVVEIVIYDLPDRDCAALASNGELSIAGNDTINVNGTATQLSGTGLQEYENDYINPIYNILAPYGNNPNLRFALVVEDDSLPNLITNTGIGGASPIANCVAANNGQTYSQGISMSGVYVQGIAYAINKFHQLPNVYNYLDVGHHAWLGWPANMGAAVTFFKDFVTTQLTDSYASVDGFITNTANYGAVKEPFLTWNEQVGGGPVYSSGCTSNWCGFQYNPQIDEQDYAVNFAAALTTPASSSYTFADGTSVAGGGFPSGLGFLIDTSRDGWGSSLRPTGPSTSTVLDTFVQDSMIDLRDDAGQWCNQANAGLGVPPTATPSPGILAYVWIKPPGESDGNYPGSVYAGTNDGALDGVASTVGDPNCNPTHSNALANSQVTNALANSPSAGTFWISEFTMYVQNADPVVPSSTAPGFSVSASSVSVEQGTTATSSVSVSAINGFNSAVALTVSGLPSGVTASFNPASVTGSAGSTLTFTASNTATVGSATVTVTGTSGSTTETATLTLTVTAEPNFTISASPSAVTIPAGSNPTSTITVTFVGGLTGSVSLSATGLPSGVSANFAPSSLNASGTSVVNFSAQSNTPAGTTNISIVGTDGSVTHSATIALTIPGSGFTLSPSASSLSVTQGSSGTDTITVNDTGGFTGSVTLAASGLPSGVTAAFGTNPTTGTSVLTLTASSTATTGVFTVTVTGTSGSVTASTSFTLTVASKSGFTLSPSASSASVTQGGSVTDTITVTDVGGFTGSVTLAASGLPSGVTAAFGTNPTTGSSVLTLTAGSAATTGAATVTITGTSGSVTATTSIALTVNPKSGFTLAPAASSASVTQGSSVTDTITVTDVGGFTGSVTLAASGLPSGVTAAFGTNPTTGTSVLTLTAGSTAAAGTSTVTITGTSGTVTASTTIALTVNTSGSGVKCTVDYTITNQWPGGFGAAVVINNTGTTAISSWTLTWSFANGQTVTQLWNGSETQSGANVTVTNLSYNGSIPAGGSYNGMGFNGSWNNTTNSIPTAISLNGTACTVN